MAKVAMSDLAYMRCREAAELAGVSLDDWMLAAGVCGAILKLNLYTLCERAAHMSGISVEEYLTR